MIILGSIFVLLMGVVMLFSPNLYTTLLRVGKVLPQASLPNCTSSPLALAACAACW